MTKIILSDKCAHKKMVYINVEKNKLGSLFYEKNLNLLLNLDPKLCFCRSYNNMAFYDGYDDEFTGFDINKWYIFLYNTDNDKKTDFCCGFVPLSKIEVMQPIENESGGDEIQSSWRKKVHCYFIQELLNLFSNTKQLSVYHSPYRFRSKSC